MFIFSSNFISGSKVRIFQVEGDYPCLNARQHGLPFDFELFTPIQSCFYNEYDVNRNTIVSSATGTGKSPIIFIAASRTMQGGGRVILTAPTRQLVKELYGAAVNLFGRHVVGLNNGTEKLHEKLLVVSTPEGFVSAVRSHRDWVSGKLLIVDEAHNLLTTGRGAELDAAITLARKSGMTLLLLSGTLPDLTSIAEYLGADVFIANYKKTKITVEEIIVPDDVFLNDRELNPASIRLKSLEKLLKKHKHEYILIFVPTKDVGEVLSAKFGVPFHCASIDEAEKNRIVSEFCCGKIKTIIATTTLAQGVNTPADIVIVFGTRCGGSYFDFMTVGQMFGRAGRGKDTATAYIIGDVIEVVNAKKYTVGKNIILPTESVVMTELALSERRINDLISAVGETYAASVLRDENAVKNSVQKTIQALLNSRILHDNNGVLKLTNEGLLLARYYIPPQTYIRYVKLARALAKQPKQEGVFNIYSKQGGIPLVLGEDAIYSGVILMSVICNIIPKDCPPRHEKDMTMRLLKMSLQSSHDGVEFDKEVSPKATGLLLSYLRNYKSIPPYFMGVLKDAERWTSMLTDMERYKVHSEAPGLRWLLDIIKVYKVLMAGGRVVEVKAPAVLLPVQQESLVA